MPTPPPNEERLRLLSPSELAGFLGVPIKTIYQWRYKGEGPRGYRVGRHIRFRWSDVRVWLDERADDVDERDDSR